jgi:hypothetical protein
MPHYVDGTLAKVGDIIRGKPYNFGKEVVGEVLQIVQAETCNLVVGFLATKRSETAPKDGPGQTSFQPNEGLRIDLEPRYDYGETKAFALISRPGDETRGGL